MASAVVAVDEPGEMNVQEQVSITPSRISAVFGSTRPRARTLSGPGSGPQLAPSPSTPTLEKLTRPRKMSETNKGTAGPPRGHVSAGVTTNRPDSPDLDTILATTPRPRRRASAAFSVRTRSRTGSVTSPLGWRVSDIDQDGAEQPESDEELRLDDEGSESDSSIDLHTPLPHLMFRDGLLSPRSKLLPQGTASSFPYLMEEDEEGNDLDRSKSVLSVASTSGSVMTKSGLLYKDPRDTVRRRRRHRDGQLLRAGMGLTTGLGWSDSEDEDAPSTLTRRLIQTSISRRPSTSMARRLSQSIRDDESPAPTRPSPHTKGVPRSASVSITSLSSFGRPGTSESSSSAESQPGKHVRAQSITSGTTPTTTSSSLPSTPNAVGTATSSPRLPKSFEMKAALSRVRTGSTGTFGKPKTPPIPNADVPAMRERTMSATSSASTGSVYSSGSSGSVYSSGSSSSSSGSSTQSGGSTTTTGTVPRPLRLPQANSFSRLSRPPSVFGSVSGLPQALAKSKNAIGGLAGPRTISVSRATGIAASTPARMHKPSPSVSASAPPRPYSPRSPVRTPTESPSVSPSDSGISDSPSPSLRARALVAGPRPKPRTGTGMMYRTSSYSSLQATAMRMRSMSTVTSSSGGVMF